MVYWHRGHISLMVNWTLMVFWTPSFLIKIKARGSIYHRAFDIPWVGRSKYHGKGVWHTMGRRVKIPWEGGLIYHGYWIQNIMVRGFEIPWEISFKILPSQIYSLGENLAAKVTNVWEKLALISYHRSYTSLKGIWQFWYKWTRYCCSIKLEFWSLKNKNGQAYLKIEIN